MSNLDNIFDDVIEEITVKPPIAILKELAQILEKKTGGLLVGKVQQSVSKGGDFTLEFFIVAPSLNNYTHAIFELQHDLTLYPLAASTYYENGVRQIQNQDELERLLKSIFSSSKVKPVINGLLAQIKSEKEEYNDMPF